MGSESFECVVVGTGFASTFFLREYLKQASPESRILVLERGRMASAAAGEDHVPKEFHFESSFINRTPQKPWIGRIQFGGGTCWLGNTPRPHPSDFEMKTRYGVGEDWPLSYADLEPALTEVEEVMGISGSDDGPFPRSRPYPVPPHPMNSFDLALAKKYPGLHLPMPTSRSNDPRRRPRCCANAVCSTCPIRSKFQIDQHLSHIYLDPRVTRRLESKVERLDIGGGVVRGVYYSHGGKEYRVGADLVAVGTHAIANPYILLRSGLQDAALGRYLHEQFSVDVQIDLDGLDSLDGNQLVTGLGIMFHDDESRSTRAACNIESWNAPWLRAERGRWRQRAFLKFVFEDLPSRDNRVTIAEEDETRPAVSYAAIGPYTQAGIDTVPSLVEKLIDGLPVEGYNLVPKPDPNTLGSDAHVQGTTRMGSDPETSVVDRDLRHHRVRNLVVLGSSVFTTCMCANPTLILSALSVLAARRLVS